MSMPPEGSGDGGSGAPSMPAGSNPWTEHRNAQGRVYWYHQTEKRSVWEKPTELKTARERAIDSTPWKEYQSGERKYYVHSVTKESSWTLPKELQDLFESIPDEQSPAPGTSTATNGGRQNSAMSPGGQPMQPVYSGPPPGFPPSNGMSLSPVSGHGASGMQPGLASSPASQLSTRPPVQPSSTFHGGGEEAFFQLLKEKRIDQSWTWEQTMREIITEPLYKSLATLAERKAAFSKYISNLKEEEESNRKERAKEIEPRIRAQLQPLIDDGNVKAWLSYEGMLCRCGDQSAWKALESVGLGEARELWAVMRREMRENDSAKAREVRHRNMDLLMSMLRTFEPDVMTRWKDAKQTIMDSDEWRKDAHLREMDMSDMVTVFDEYMKSIEKEKTQELQEKANGRKRQDRIRRDWCREALQEGKKAGWIHPRTDFGDVYDRLRSEKEFVEMLAQPGSSPLDLFFDVLDEMEDQLRDATRTVETLLAKNSEGGFRVREETSWDEFNSTLQKAVENKEGSFVTEMDGQTQKLVFEELQRISKEENRRIERKLRHLSEDLRYALKKVAHHNPELFDVDTALSQPWPQVEEKLQGLRLPEWKAFEVLTMPIEQERLEEARKGAWERFIKRQKEKVDEQRKTKEHQTEQSSPKGRRGDDGEEDERRRSSRRAGRVDDEDSTRARSGISRRERRAGDLDYGKERSRKERRRSEAAEDFEAVKRRKQEQAPGAEADEAIDSEKEEGEV